MHHTTKMRQSLAKLTLQNIKAYAKQTANEERIERSVALTCADEELLKPTKSVCMLAQGVARVWQSLLRERLTLAL
jgi:hypothetical protein